MGAKNETKSFRSAIAFDKGNLVLAVITLLVGAILGNLLPALYQDPVNPSYWPLWLIAASCVILVAGVGGFIVIVAHQKAESNIATSAVADQVKKMEKTNESIFDLVDQTVSRQAALIPRDEIYKEMAQAFNEATSSISVITLLAVDWEIGKRNWEPALTDTPYRMEYYEAVKKAIIRDGVCYERVWQVPSEKGEVAMEVLFTDPIHKEEYELIKECQKKSPHLAKFMIATTITTVSFILIDGKKLFVNIDLYNEETRQLESPYMLFIKDVTGGVFDPLKGVIARFKPLVT